MLQGRLQIREFAANGHDLIILILAPTVIFCAVLAFLLSRSVLIALSRARAVVQGVEAGAAGEEIRDGNAATGASATRHSDRGRDDQHNCEDLLPRGDAAHSALGDTKETEQQCDPENMKREPPCENGKRTCRQGPLLRHDARLSALSRVLSVAGLRRAVGVPPRDRAGSSRRTQWICQPSSRPGTIQTE